MRHCKGTVLLICSILLEKGQKISSSSSSSSSVKRVKGLLTISGGRFIPILPSLIIHSLNQLLSINQLSTLNYLFLSFVKLYIQLIPFFFSFYFFLFFYFIYLSLIIIPIELFISSYSYQPIKRHTFGVE